MKYETVIGLEVHVQLATQSKMFCSCRADYQSAGVNTRVCAVCLGLPGALPVINRKAVEYTIMTGLALNCRIPEYSKFDRKNYPYPDLMKGYQISQYDLPLAVDGRLEIEVEGQVRRIGVERVHLEEDVAKLQHSPSETGESYSLVDVNRSGVPLMEIVSRPDLSSPEEARAYLTTLHAILVYLGVSTGNMQDGSFRCDANISIRPEGSAKYGKRTEIKNVNSFHNVFMALQYEVDRQRKVVDGGGEVVQETRGWVDDRNVTVSQRSKEYAHDYRYFPEPDLPPLILDPAWVSTLQERLPELPVARRVRFSEEYGLSGYDAGQLTESKPVADYFESAVAHKGFAGAPLLSPTFEQKEAGNTLLQDFYKNICNWIMGDLSRLLNLENQPIAACRVTPDHLAELVALVQSGDISSTIAKTVLEESFYSGDSPGKIVDDKGYAQINDSSTVEKALAEALEANPKAVDDYIQGKETAARFLVGQVMKITRGSANPELVNQLVNRELAAKREAASQQAS